MRTKRGVVRGQMRYGVLVVGIKLRFSLSLSLSCGPSLASPYTPPPPSSVTTRLGFVHAVPRVAGSSGDVCAAQ